MGIDNFFSVEAVYALLESQRENYQYCLLPFNLIVIEAQDPVQLLFQGMEKLAGPQNSVCEDMSAGNHRCILHAQLSFTSRQGLRPHMPAHAFNPTLWNKGRWISRSSRTAGLYIVRYCLKNKITTKGLMQSRLAFNSSCSSLQHSNARTSYLQEPWVSC